MSTAIEWFKSELEQLDTPFARNGSDCPELHDKQVEAYKAAIKALTITDYPAYWITYYPDDPSGEYDNEVHSHSGAKACAARIAKEINGYIVPVYYSDIEKEY